jgi:hypothetical protein
MRSSVLPKKAFEEPLTQEQRRRMGKAHDIHKSFVRFVKSLLSKNIFPVRQYKKWQLKY